MVHILAMGLALLVPGADPPPTPAPADSAADRVVLRDGSILLGRVVDAPRRTAVSVVVGRAWADKTLPAARMKVWKSAENRSQKRALSSRVARLRTWKDERGETRGDPVASWIDSELQRLADPASGSPSRLMKVTIDRREVRDVVRVSPELERLMTLGWRLGFKAVESMTPADLKAAVQGRGFLPEGTETPSIDDLLPLEAETDARWAIRRASTEVQAERTLRFIRYQGLVMPEGVPGQPPALPDALGALKGILGGGDEAQPDPLLEKARGVAGRGRRGMVVTRMEIAPDVSAVQVEATLWTRTGADRWEPSLRHEATIRTDDLKPGAGEDLANDPQVKSVFEVVEGLGLGAIDPAMKQRSLAIGSATRQALHVAQAALDRQIQEAALPVDDTPAAPSKRE